MSEDGANRESDARPRLWTLGAIAAVTALVAYAGATTGEWRGAAVTEVQVLVVGLVTYLGVR